MTNDYIGAQLKAIITRLQQAGIEDITTEVISLVGEGGTRRFKFYTEDQWMTPERKANEATILIGKHYKGYKKPAYVVEYKGTIYVVELK